MAPKAKRAPAPKAKAKVRAAPKGKAAARPATPAPKATVRRAASKSDVASPKGKAPARAVAPEPRAAVKRGASKSDVAGTPPRKAAKGGGGGRPVDSAVPNKGDYSVVDDWSVLLNQTNVGANNNKYYKIQILQKGGQFFCWTHWGRVGHIGQFKLEPGNMASSEAGFKSKFRSKTSVDYANLSSHDWTPKIGKYTYIETDEKEGADGGGGDAPLGKLTVPQIEKGQGVLKKIEGALVKSDAGKLNALSSEFYTLIPHNFGFKVPPAISTRDMLSAEEELLKFYLRMGFEEVGGKDKLSPVEGIMELDLPGTLEAACSKLCKGPDINNSNKKGREHCSKQSGNPRKAMEYSLYAAIMLYTSNAIYRDLNAVLRSEDRTKIKKYFLYLRMLLEALDRLPQQKKTVWRGLSVDLFDQYKVGSTITWWGVSSTTADIAVAKNFMNGCGGKCTLLTIESKTAADISAVTFFGNEKENLMAPGTQLKVLSSKREGNVTHIKLQETGRALK